MKKLVLFLIIISAGSAFAQFSPILTISDPNNGGLGTALDPVGDINNDGFPDYLAGAWLEDVLSTANAGKAYIISGADQTVIRELVSPSPIAEGWFGYSVASGYDLNSDGIIDFVIGAPGETGGASGSGRVHAFSGSDGSLLYSINSFSPAVDGRFGNAVLIQNDLDGVGGPEIVVGAYQEFGSSATAAGRVHVYNRNSYRNTILSGTEKDRGGFGWRLASASNFKGKSVLLVSAVFENPNTSPINSGVLHAFDMTTAGSPLLVRIQDGSPGLFANFGWSITSYLDPGDGGSELLVMDGTGRVVGIESDGTQKFTTTSGGTSVTAGKFDKNNVPDFATVNNLFFDGLNYSNATGLPYGGAGFFLYENGFGDAIATLGDGDNDGANEVVAFSAGGIGLMSLRQLNSNLAAVPTGFSRTDYTTGPSPNAVSSGDFDGDGKFDLVVANANSNSVSIFHNTTAAVGTISYSAKVDYPVGVTPVGVAVGDLDGDGKLDVAVANLNSNKISALRNTSAAIGAISFAAKEDFETGLYPWSVAIGDLDGDGKADLALSNSSSNTISVLRNTSAGTGNIGFATKVDYASGASPWIIAIGELDGDGKLDLAVANTNDNTVSVFKNTSTGAGNITYAPKVDYTVGSFPRSVIINDLNADGKADLAVTNQASNTVSILRNTTAAGTINFATKVDYATGTGPWSMAKGDLYGNGKVDLAIGNYNNGTVTVLKNTSTGPGAIYFALKEDYPIGSYPRSVSISDLDKDGMPDIAAVNEGNGKLSILRNVIPNIASFSPTSAGASSTVSISGTNFTDATAVSFGGTSATSFNVVSLTSMTAVVGSGTSGNISVVTPIGTATKSGFTWVLAPSIASINPTSALSGATVTITGTNFTGATGVSFGGTAAASFTVVSPTSITAVVGSGTSGSVSVTTPGGAATLAGFIFIPTPTIATFNPTSGPVSTSVTITGTNFSTTAANNIVKFNGTAATITGAPTATSIVTSVPSGASTGKITVEVSGVVATSSTDFAVTSAPPPTIASFNPTAGPVATAVTISGTNFSTTAASNIVKFNGTVATVTASTATSVTTSVPAGATTGTITVTVGGQTATSTTNFTVTNTVADIDGNVYTTVAIGTQVWMGQNLNTTKYSDGTTIPLIAGGTAWSNATTPGYCWFNNDQATNGPTYGALYNWYAVDKSSNGNKNVCPTGWHLPSDGDWTTLTTYLGDEGVAGGKLKEVGTTHWSNPNTGATNETGFSAVPGGDRVGSGAFPGMGVVGLWWSGTGLNTTDAYGRAMNYNNTNVDRFNYSKFFGFSVRCLVDQVISLAPTVMSFNPTSGSVGTSVTITGTNFSTTAANNIVKFNGTVAIITGTPTATSIVTAVPTGATTGKITVEVAGQVGTSSTDFAVTAASSLTITNESFGTTYDKGSTLTLSVTVSDASLVSTVNLKTRGITEAATALKSVAVTAVGNKFEKIIAAADLTDAIGLTYYFEVLDKQTTPAVITSTTGKAYVKFPVSSTDQVLPGLSFGNQVSNYQIISVPLDLTDKSVSKVFASLMPYDKTKWRLFDFANNDNREFSAFSTIDAGKGYWLIVKTNTTINPGEGKTVQADDTSPFTINLTTGWNLIGNPYNFRVSWTDVLAANSGSAAAGVTNLKVFSGGALTNGTVLEKYRGAFVFTNNAIAMKIPVTKTLSGRVMEEKGIENALDQNHWEVKLNLKNGLLSNELGGIGMHPNAALKGKDEFDEVSVPLPDGLGLFELVYPHPEVFTNFNKEVVPTQEYYAWDFDVKRDDPSASLDLSWPNYYFGDNDKQLILFDPFSLQVIDMRMTNHFTLSERSEKVRIFFGGKEYIQQALDKELPWLGNPYPNPARVDVTIPFRVPETKDQMDVQIKIYNSQGKEVAVPISQHLEKGSYEVKWQSQESGLFVVRMKIGQQETRSTKVIINP